MQFLLIQNNLHICPEFTKDLQLGKKTQRKARLALILRASHPPALLAEMPAHSLVLPGIAGDVPAAGTLEMVPLDTTSSTTTLV